jgi:ankyrin repeat protein
MHEAILRGQADLVAFLIDAGSDVNAPSAGGSRFSSARSFISSLAVAHRRICARVHR